MLTHGLFIVLLYVLPIVFCNTPIPTSTPAPTYFKHTLNTSIDCSVGCSFTDPNIWMIQNVTDGGDEAYMLTKGDLYYMTSEANIIITASGGDIEFGYLFVNGTGVTFVVDAYMNGSSIQVVCGQLLVKGTLELTEVIVWGLGDSLFDLQAGSTLVASLGCYFFHGLIKAASGSNMNCDLAPITDATVDIQTTPYIGSISIQYSNVTFAAGLIGTDLTVGYGSNVVIYSQFVGSIATLYNVSVTLVDLQPNSIIENNGSGNNLGSLILQNVEMKNFSSLQVSNVFLVNSTLSLADGFEISDSVHIDKDSSLNISNAVTIFNLVNEGQLFVSQGILTGSYEQTSEGTTFILTEEAFKITENAILSGEVHYSIGNEAPSGLYEKNLVMSVDGSITGKFENVRIFSSNNDTNGLKVKYSSHALHLVYSRMWILAVSLPAFACIIIVVIFVVRRKVKGRAESRLFKQQLLNHYQSIN